MGRLIHNGTSKKYSHKHDQPVWFLSLRFNLGALWQCQCGKYLRLHQAFPGGILYWVGTTFKEEDKELLGQD